MRQIPVLARFLLGTALAFFLIATLIAPLAAQESDAEKPLDSTVMAVQDSSLSLHDLDILMVPLTAEDLSGVADFWQGYVRTALAKVARLNLQIRKGDAAQKEKDRAQLSTETEALDGLLQIYAHVLNNWERKGASPEDWQAHRSYLTAVHADSVRTTDLRTLIGHMTNWLFSFEGGLGVLVKVLGVLLAIWGMMFVARFVRKMAEDGLAKTTSLSNLLKSFVLTVVYWATFSIGILITLALFGVNVTPLFAIVGGLSFILGFALQDTLSNLASGLMIMVLKPFDTGDFIETAGISGTVDEMSVVSTKVRTFDNQIIVVPNSKIWGDVITNVSASETRRVDLVFGIAYTDSAAHAITVLQGLVAEHNLCLKSPEPEIFVGELGDSSVNVFCRPWCKNGDYWTVYWDLTGQAKERFDAEGISIPFPQRDVHLYPAGQSEGSA